MRQVIRFEANQPVTVALEFPEGIQVQGRGGPQVRYSLTENRMMYLDPEPARALGLLNVQPGELFTVTKRVQSGKSPWWDFARVKTAAAGSTASVPSSTSQTSQPALKMQPSPVSAPNPAILPGVVKRIPPQTTHQTPPPNGGLQLTKTPPLKPSYEEAFRECLRIVREGLNDAGEAWSDHSVQAMTSTLFIQAAREGTMRFVAPKSEKVA